MKPGAAVAVAGEMAPPSELQGNRRADAKTATAEDVASSDEET
jgi:hypothetical protein